MEALIHADIHANRQPGKYQLMLTKMLQDTNAFKIPLHANKHANRHPWKHFLILRNMLTNMIMTPIQ